MPSSLDLNGTWMIRGFDGQHGSPEACVGEDVDESLFIEAQVPGDVHLDLERAGWIEDCNVAMNAQAARWVEEQVWVYRTRFAAPKQALEQRTWLVFEGLDLNAVIYLNGEEVGRHDNVFVPCRLDVTGKLRQGENTLAVRIESGLFSVVDKPGTCYNSTLDNILTKRFWLRKPQCQFSWDWNARLVNVGIWRPVRLEWADTARIDAVTVYPELADDHKTARIHIRVFVENLSDSGRKAVLRVRVAESGSAVEKEVELAAGVSAHDLAAEIANPKLWWPRPHGDQPLYNVGVELLVGGRVVDTAKRRTGIRSIRISQDPHPDGGDYFILEVNGRPIFAKGGNWVPPDLIYARIDADRYRKLVELAVGANFNALRVWGGGLYAGHAFLDACDELGVLIWHDFIFACSTYPGDDPDFLLNVRKEISHIVRDLSPHPSLVVWCGNNEIEWLFSDWHRSRGKPNPDYAIYHKEIPNIIRREDPSRPYWPSSPYSTDQRYPNDPTTGDQHPWHVSLQQDGPNFWAYRGDLDRFPNEGGVLGASSPATLRQFLPEGQRRVGSPSWEFHDNACNYWGVGKMTAQFIEYWLGVKAEDLSYDDYIFYSAILQAEGLQEYANNFRRRMYSSASAIFWMYNDSWPVTHGWTIVDYYLRRKLAYHPVRRAFAPVQVIPAIEGDKVLIFGVNETPAAWSGEVRFGLFKLAGELPMDITSSVALPPNAATVIGEVPISHWDRIGVENSGAFAALIGKDRVIAQNRIFAARFRDLKFAEPQIKVERRGDYAVFSSPTFVWAVCLDMDGEASLEDDVFDLLPGVQYPVPWPSDRALPDVWRCGSADAGFLLGTATTARS